MTTYHQSFPSWPSILFNEDAVQNGTVAQAVHGIAIELAIKHLAGHAHGHSGAQFGINGAPLALAPAAVARLPFRPLPYFSGVQVWFLADGTLDGACTLTVYCGTKSASKTWTGLGLTDDATESIGWQSVTIPDAGTSLATTYNSLADSGFHLALTNASPAATINLYAAYALQLHTQALAES